VGDVTKYFPELKSYNGGSIAEFLMEESTVLGDLLSPTALITVLFLAFCVSRIKSILLPRFSAMGKKLAVQTHGSEWVLKNPERILKFGEYVFRLLYHSMISTFGLYYFYTAEWWDRDQGGTLNLWLNYPFQPIKPGMTFFYLIQAAYNVQELVYLANISIALRPSSSFPYRRLAWAPTCRGDFREMALHHIITNSLIFGSSHYRLHRIGSIVFQVHDISDVPVDLSKLANFLKWHRTTAVCFTGMAILWAMTRLGIFPFVVTYSAMFESQQLLKEGYIPSIYFFCWRSFFVLLLIAITVLHFLWFLIFIKIGFVLVTKGEAHDYSEHKNGEHFTKATKRRD